MASTRLIHHSCTRSHSLAAISAGAERLFWRLVVLTEDHGRFEADLILIRTSAFPLMLDKVSDEDVEGWLREIEEQDMIRTYMAGNGKRYGYFVKWNKYQTVRAKYSRYPGPLTSADTCEQTSTFVKLDEGSRFAPYSYDSSFLVFWNYYPKKKSKQDAKKVWLRLKPDETLAKQILDALALQKKSDQWTRDSGKFIPFPATWLNGRRWEDELDADPTKDWRYGLSPREILEKDKLARLGGFADHDAELSDYRRVRT